MIRTPAAEHILGSAPTQFEIDTPPPDENACLMDRQKTGPPFRAFTLIKLLVVVAIFAILASLLVPSVVRTKETVRKLACANNQRQIITSTLLYAHQNDGAFPPRTSGQEKDNPRWPGRLFAFYQNTKALVCPSDRKDPPPATVTTHIHPADLAPRSYIS